MENHDHGLGRVWNYGKIIGKVMEDLGKLPLLSSGKNQSLLLKLVDL